MSSLSNFNLQTWPLKKLRALPNFFGMHMHITVTTPRPPLAAVLLKSAVWESLNDFPPCEGLGEEGKSDQVFQPFCLFVFLWGVWKRENEKKNRSHCHNLSQHCHSPFSHPFSKTGQWCLRRRLWVHVIEWTNSEFQKLSLSKQGYKKQNLSFENEF